MQATEALCAISALQISKKHFATSDFFVKMKLLPTVHIFFLVSKLLLTKSFLWSWSFFKLYFPVSGLLRENKAYQWSLIFLIVKLHGKLRAIHIYFLLLRTENLMGYFPHSTKFFLVYSRVMRRSTDTLGNNMLDLFHSWPLWTIE